MKKLTLIGAIALCSIVPLVNTGCPSCKDALALCDLAISAFTAPIEVTVNQAFDVISKIQNEESDGECTTTELASTTVNLLEIFLNDGNGNWELVGRRDNIPQQAINPGDLATLLQKLTIHASGDYRLDYYDDHVNGVEERNENNNYDNLPTGGRADLKAAMQATNNFASTYLTVRPLPDGTTRIEGKPIVEFH